MADPITDSMIKQILAQQYTGQTGVVGNAGGPETSLAVPATQNPFAAAGAFAARNSRRLDNLINSGAAASQNALAMAMKMRIAQMEAASNRFNTLATNADKLAPISGGQLITSEMFPKSNDPYAVGADSRRVAGERADIAKTLSEAFGSFVGAGQQPAFAPEQDKAAGITGYTPVPRDAELKAAGDGALKGEYVHGRGTGPGIVVKGPLDRVEAYRDRVEGGLGKPPFPGSKQGGHSSAPTPKAEAQQEQKAAEPKNQTPKPGEEGSDITADEQALLNDANSRNKLVQFSIITQDGKRMLKATNTQTGQSALQELQ